MKTLGGAIRGLLGVATSALAAIAAVTSSLDAGGDLVPFFVALTFGGGVAAWAAQPPFDGIRRRLAQGIAIGWSVAAVWVGVLLVGFVAQASSPPPVPGQTYLGLSATAYHLIGLYGGCAMVLLLAFVEDPDPSVA